MLHDCGTVLPEPGFLPGLREACTRHGTLLVMDETHTQFDRYGGAVTRYGIAPDMVTGGKGISGGIPIGALGMTGELADLVATQLAAQLADELGDIVGIALGGTPYANALSPAWAGVVLTELMTPAEHRRIAGLGDRLADGIEAAARSRGLPWAPTGWVPAPATACDPSCPATPARRTPASTRCSPTPDGSTSPTAASGTPSAPPARTPDSPTTPPTSTPTSASSTPSSTRCARTERRVGRGRHGDAPTRTGRTGTDGGAEDAPEQRRAT